MVDRYIIDYVVLKMPRFFSSQLRLYFVALFVVNFILSSFLSVWSLLYYLSTTPCPVCGSSTVTPWLGFSIRLRKNSSSSPRFGFLILGQIVFSCVFTDKPIELEGKQRRIAFTYIIFPRKTPKSTVPIILYLYRKANESVSASLTSNVTKRLLMKL